MVRASLLRIFIIFDFFLGPFVRVSGVRRQFLVCSLEQPSPAISQMAVCVLQLFLRARRNLGLPSEGQSGKLLAVDTPDLRALQQGDADAWDQAFRWLWPTAFAVAQLKLQAFLPADVEDVAIESLEELVEKVKEVNQVEELKLLAASIAHHRAVSRLREHFARKRGGGQTESLQARQEADIRDCDPAGGDSPLDQLGQAELAELLGKVQTGLKPEQRAIISDFFLHGLTYEEIAAKHDVAVGSVGVYLKRGLEGIRRCGARHPKLLKELEAFLR